MIIHLLVVLLSIGIHKGLPSIPKWNRRVRTVNRLIFFMVFSLYLFRYYHPSCHFHFAIYYERVDVHACCKVAGIDGDVCFAALSDGKALHLLAAHVSIYLDLSAFYIDTPREFTI